MNNYVDRGVLSLETKLRTGMIVVLTSCACDCVIFIASV